MEELREIILKSIELYNSMEGVEKVALVETKKLQNTPINQIDLIDVSNLYVCQYNDNQVGLFKKIDYSTPIKYDMLYGDYYNSGMIFIGYKSDYIGIKITHDRYHQKNYWESSGYKTRWDYTDYLVNCNMTNAVSFDDMRQIMYENDKIGPYSMGNATNQELLEVLRYSKSYFISDSKAPKTL